MDGCAGAWTQLWAYNSASSDTTINWTLPSVPEGSHTIYFKVTDDAGNTNDTCAYSWTFIYRPPSVSLLSSFRLDKCTDVDTLWIYVDSNLVNMAAAFLKIAYDDNFITPIQVIKGPALVPPEDFQLFPYIYPDSILISFAVLGGYLDGPGSIVGIVLTADSEVASTELSFVRSVLRDYPENHDIPHNTTGAEIQIDCTVPTVVVDSPPSGGSYNYLPTLTIHFQDDLSVDKGYHQIDDYTGAWSEFWPHNCSVNDTAIGWTVPSMPEGSHDIYFKVTDDANNSNSDTATYFWNFIYDITPPSAPLLISPADSTVTDDNTPTFVWSSTAGSGGTYTLEYSTVPFTSPVIVSGLEDTTYTASTALPDDEYYWHVKAIDRASNEGEYQGEPFVFTIDTGTPAVPVLLSPPDLSYTCDFTPTFTWTSSSQVLAGSSGIFAGSDAVGSKDVPVTYTLHILDVAIVEGIAQSMYTLPDTLALDVTTYWWRVEAVDLADNHSGFQDIPFQFTVFLPGDANADRVLDLGDAVYLLNYLFKHGSTPQPLRRGDCNADEEVDLGDVVYLLNYLFKGGPAPICY